MMLDTTNWKKFRLDDLFEIKQGYYNAKPDSSTCGKIPFIGASDSNNGVTSLHNIEDIDKSSKHSDDTLGDKIFDGNCICVTNDGSVGYAYYQEMPFTCSHSVNPLYPNPAMEWTMNKYNALFLCCVIEQERFRWAYGRKWRPSRMKESAISLPVDSTGKPDWQYMEDYIKEIVDEVKEKFRTSV